MSLKDEFRDILHNRTDVARFNLGTENKSGVDVMFRRNIKAAEIVDEETGTEDDEVFYKFKGSISSPEELIYRLDNKRPPE